VFNKPERSEGTLYSWNEESHDAWNELSMAPMILKQVLIIYGDNNQN